MLDEALRNGAGNDGSQTRQTARADDDEVRAALVGQARIDLQIPSTMPLVVSATASSPAAFASWTPSAATSDAVRVQSVEVVRRRAGKSARSQPCRRAPDIEDDGSASGQQPARVLDRLTSARRAVVANQDRGDVRRGLRTAPRPTRPSPPVDEFGRERARVEMGDGRGTAIARSTSRARPSSPERSSVLRMACSSDDRRAHLTLLRPPIVPLHYPTPRVPAPCGPDPRPTRTRPHLQPSVKAHGHGRRCRHRRLRTRAR